MSQSYQTPSMVNFYVRPKLEAICVNLGNYHLTVYNSIYPDKFFQGKDFYVLGGDVFSSRLLNVFDEASAIKKFTSYRNGKVIDTFTLYYCKNYHGNAIYFKNLSNS